MADARWGPTAGVGRRRRVLASRVCFGAHRNVREEHSRLSKRVIVHLENERLRLLRRVTEERDNFLVLRVCARASGAPAREESGAGGRSSESRARATSPRRHLPV